VRIEGLHLAAVATVQDLLGGELFRGGPGVGDREGEGQRGQEQGERFQHDVSSDGLGVEPG